VSDPTSARAASRAEAHDAAAGGAHPADPNAGIVVGTPPSRGARLLALAVAVVTLALLVGLALRMGS
jgi:hypothetical protein